MSQIRVRNRLRRNENIAGTTVVILAGAVPVTGTTAANGVATLDTSKLADGAYVFTVTPASTISDPVGPATASSPTPGDRVFRSLVGSLAVASGKIVSGTVAATHRLNGDVVWASPSNLTVGLQPVWMRSPNNGGRGSNPITMIIVHHTGGPVIGPAINTFLSTSEQTSAHYLIDTDGQIVKMVQDNRRANHAGESHWAGVKGINSVSIGIEIVNASGAYPAAQYTALLDLIARLRGSFSTIIDWNIVGHSDIATTDGVLGRKSSDPGLQFEWSRLEDRNFGMRRMVGPFPATIYASFFNAFPGETLRKSDNDSKRTFGGVKRTTITGNPIRELQNDLTRIGYFVGTPDGDFGNKTKGAVQMLQEHFFAGGRGHKSPDGRVDVQTAHLIKGVAGAHP
jgi:N-acetyl-anhydromuramyl-L-alanine amidase AmpD